MVKEITTRYIRHDEFTANSKSLTLQPRKINTLQGASHL